MSTSCGKNVQEKIFLNIILNFIKMRKTDANLNYYDK
jgi:hypothetical protein